MLFIVQTSSVTGVSHGIYRFYYDFDIPGHQLGPSDLKKIRKEMDRIIRSDAAIRCEEVPSEEARCSTTSNALLSTAELCNSQFYHADDAFWSKVSRTSYKSWRVLKART